VVTETEHMPLSHVAEAPSHGVLSEREIQCLQLTASGKTSWAIADILGISPHTVNAHVRNIVRKLGVASRAHAVAEGMRRGLIR
jgi:LuxR family transcriptional regulator, quorum-sensing system regulator BjaR1